MTLIKRHAALKRNVTTDEVGNVAAFLCSDLASGVTGEITYVDGGMNITAAGSVERLVAVLNKLWIVFDICH